MKTPEPIKKVPIQYIKGSPEFLLFVRRYAFIVPIVLIPLYYFYPHLSFFLVFLVFLYVAFIYPYAPKPMFEKFKNNKPESHPYVYMGIDKYNMPVEVPVNLLKQHVLLLGSTGSGKTTFLRYFLKTLLKTGGGCCFVDGKADVADMYQIFYSEVCEADREEDLYVINFLNPSQSHSFNPLLYGDANFLSEILAGLLKQASGDQVYWQERGLELMRSTLSVLVWMRDNMGLKLSVKTIHEYLNLHKLIELAKNPDIPDEDLSKGMPIPVKSRLKNYLNSLTPNWDKDEINPEEMAEAIRQFGYGVQQWSSMLDLLGGAYANIFNTDDPDIDIKDIVLNNKILYVLLPALKQSPQTLSALGRMILSVFKIVFSELIGETIVGDSQALYEETKSKKPDPPFLLIMDEAGSYLPDDIDTVLAQARSTGVSVVISVQEVASLFKVNETVAKRMLNNTKIKICLAIDDADTAKYIVERAGETWILVPSVRRELGDFSEQVGNFDGGLSMQRHKKVEEIDLYALRVGEGYIIYQDVIRRFRFPYITAPRPKELKLIKWVPITSNGEQQEVVNVLVERFRPFKTKEGLVINVWDATELKWLESFSNQYGLFLSEKDVGVLSIQNGEWYDFLETLTNEMVIDPEFATFSIPTPEVWEDFKKSLFSV